MPLAKILKWVGIIFSALGVCLLGSAAVRTHRLQFDALILPVSLTPGTVETPRFTTGLHERYEISLEFDRHSSVKDMECFLGAATVPPKSCEGAPNLIDASWKVLSEGEVVAEGDSTRSSSPTFNYPKDALGRITGGPSSRRLSGLTYSDPLSLYIGSFEAQNAHPYSLVLRLNRDASVLQEANPRLVIGIPIGLHEDYALKFALEELGGIIVAFTGVAILVVTHGLRLLGRKSGRQVAER